MDPYKSIISYGRNIAKLSEVVKRCFTKETGKSVSREDWSTFLEHGYSLMNIIRKLLQFEKEIISINDNDQLLSFSNGVKTLCTFNDDIEESIETFNIISKRLTDNISSIWRYEDAFTSLSAFQGRTDSKSESSNILVKIKAMIGNLIAKAIEYRTALTSREKEKEDEFERTKLEILSLRRKLVDITSKEYEKQETNDDLLELDENLSMLERNDLSIIPSEALRKIEDLEREKQTLRERLQKTEDMLMLANLKIDENQAQCDVTIENYKDQVRELSDRLIDLLKGKK
jgi:hypothetical protein